MRKLVLVFTVLAAGCQGVPPAYLEADQSTFEFAAPKLEAWAGSQGDEWKKLVKAKLVSWKARIDKAKESK